MIHSRSFRLAAGGALVLLAACASAMEPTALMHFVDGAEVQAETDRQACDLALALREIASGPASRVMGLRYRDASGKAAEWTAADVLTGYLVPPEPAEAEHSEAFYLGATDPATKVAVVSLAAEAADGRDCG